MAEASTWWVWAPAAAAVGAALVVAAWRAVRSDEAGGRALGASLAAVAVWCVAQAAATLAPDAALAQPTERLALAAMTAAALAWAAFALRYADLRLPGWATLPWALAAVPLLALAWSEVGPDGPVRIHAGATVALVAALLAARWLRGGSASDVRYLALAAAAALAFLPALWPSGAAPAMAEALAAAVAGAASLVLVIGRRLFEPSARAYRRAFDASGDAQFVVDALGRVADLNPAAERWAGVPLRVARGRPLARIAPQLAALAGPDAGAGPHELRDAGDARVWSVVARPLGRGAGRLWTVRDATEQVQERERLERRSRLLAAAASLVREPRDDAGASGGAGDDLTGTLARVGEALGLASAQLIEDDGTGDAYRTLVDWSAGDGSRPPTGTSRQAYVDAGLASVRDAIRRGHATLVAAPDGGERVRMALPVREDGGPWAALVLDGGDPDELREVRDALGALVGAAAGWLERRRRRLERERDQEANAALQALTRDLLRGDDDPWRRTLEGAAEAVGGASRASLFLLCEDGSYRCAAVLGAPIDVRPGARREPADLGLPGDDGVRLLLGSTTPAGSGVSLLAPVDREGRRVAVLRLDDPDHADAFGMRESGRLTAFVAQLGALLERIELHERSERSARAQRQLAKIERLLLSTDGVEAFFPLLAGLLLDGELLPLQRVGLLRVGPDRPTLVLHGREGRDPDLEAACAASGLLDLAAGSGLAGQVGGPTPSIRTDLAGDPAWAPFLPEAEAAAVFPLRRGGEAWGAILCTAVEPGAFGPEAIAWFGQLVSALEIAMLRDRDREARERQLANLRALVATGDALLGARRRSEVVERALATLLGRTPAERAELLLLDAPRRRLRVIGDLRADGGRDELERELGEDEGPAWGPIRSERTDVLRAAEGAPAAAWMGTPVRNGDGAVVGVLTAESHRPGVRFGSDDVGLLEAVAQAAGGALVRLALLERTRRQAEDYRALWQEARGSEQRFRLLAEHVGDTVCLHHADGRFAYASPAALDTFGLPPERLLGRHPLERVVEADRAAAAEAWTASEPGGADVREAVYRVRRADGSVSWIETRSQAVRDEQGATVNLVSTSRDVTERKRVEERLLQGALYDDLTELPNRALLRDRMRHALERARRAEKRFALLFLDLDRFKEINDTLGHAVGDELLAAIGGRLTACVRGSDTVARLGGDEFCVLIEAVESDEVVTRTAERIQAALTQPFTLEGRDLFISASIGIAFSRPDYGDPEEMLRDADQAMYRAKAGGKARYEVFGSDARTISLDRLGLETALHRAIERDELRLAFQPIVEIGGGRVVGVEALVRWQHPEQGLLPAASFVPFAEETGLIVQIDRWVIDRACRQLASWSRRYPEAAAWTLSVNLSPMHFALPDPADALLALVRPSGLEPRRLRFELSEVAVRQRGEAVTRALAALHDHGVSVGIEDFGTGDVSLEALHRLRIGWLKLDRTVSRAVAEHPRRRELAAGIGALARGMGIEAIAEGVEEEADRDALGALGYVLGQGWYWSEAVPADALVARYLEPAVDDGASGVADGGRG